MARYSAILFIIVGIFVLAGCSNDNSAPLATATPVQAVTQVPLPVPTSVPHATLPTKSTAVPASQGTTTAPVDASGAYTSTGMGITRTAWEKAIGAPTSDMGSTMGGYQNNKYVVIYWGPKPGNIIEIVRQYPAGTNATLKQAQDEAHTMLPADSVFVTTSTETITGTNAIVTNQLEIYHSPSLPERYPTWLDTPFDWHTAKPGDIIIAYLYDDKGVLNAWQMDAGSRQR